MKQQKKQIKEYQKDNKEIKENKNIIYIFMMLIVPLLLDLSLDGMMQGKAYLRNIIISGLWGFLINIIEMLIVIFLIHKFCLIYKNIKNIKSLVKVYIKIISNPFFIFLITFVFFEIFNHMLGLSYRIIIIIKLLLFILMYLFLIRLIKILLFHYLNIEE